MKNSPETKQSSSIKQGDIIRLGDHVLYCGDAREVDLGTLLEGRTISCIACDPPYSVDVAASKRGLRPLLKDKDIENDGHMSDAEYTAWKVPQIRHTPSEFS